MTTSSLPSSSLSIDSHGRFSSTISASTSMTVEPDSPFQSSKRRKADQETTKVLSDEELSAILAEENEEVEDDVDDADFVEPEVELIILSDMESESEEVDVFYEPNIPISSQVSVSQISQPSSPLGTPIPLHDRQWTRQTPKNHTSHPFLLNPGINVPLTDLNTPRDFFNLLLTEELTNHIIDQTNLYAEYLSRQCTHPKALIKKWRPLGVEEFLTFLGLLLHMGTIPLSRINDYWNTDPILFDLRCFRRAMSRDRFLGILQSLHFAKNQVPNEPIPADSLYKIRPLIDIFNRTMDSIIIPSKNLCIDESMVLWRGRLVFRKYLKNNARPLGIKMYMLTETSGLILRFIVYTEENDQEVGGKAFAEKVVHKLMDGKLDVGHSLFMDSFYNSVNLVHEFLERKTYVTGTLRTNRKGNPSEVISTKPKKGEVVDYYSKHGVCVMKWRDRREVLMISSEFTGRMVAIASRRGCDFQKPECVLEYNESMGGGDRSDLIMSYYPIERKTMKWSKKMGIHVLHLCVINAFYLFKKFKIHDSNTSLYDFRNFIVKSLLPLEISPQTSYPLKRSTKGLSPHFPSIFPTPEGKTKRPRKRCRVCLANKKRQETSFFCPVCPDNPPLCVEDGCFLEFHKNMDV